MHGGTNSGAPVGNTNARVHGHYSAQVIEERQQLRQWHKLLAENLQKLP